MAVAAQRAALSLLRRRDPGAAAARASSLEGALSVGLDPELGLARAEVKHHFEGALQVALAGLDARDRMLLRLSLVSGLSCQKIGKIYGVNASTAARWLARARDQLLSAMQRHLKQTHGLEPAELGIAAGPGPQPDRAQPLGNAEGGLDSPVLAGIQIFGSRVHGAQALPGRHASGGGAGGDAGAGPAVDEAAGDHPAGEPDRAGLPGDPGVRGHPAQRAQPVDLAGQGAVGGRGGGVAR